jgi:hypothetical protein
MWLHSLPVTILCGRGGATASRVPYDPLLPVGRPKGLPGERPPLAAFLDPRFKSPPDLRFFPDDVGGTSALLLRFFSDLLTSNGSAQVLQ